MRTRSPLHFLVARGYLEGVRVLLAHEVHMDCQTACGYPPLLIAAQDQQASVPRSWSLALTPTWWMRMAEPPWAFQPRMETTTPPICSWTRGSA